VSSHCYRKKKQPQEKKKIAIEGKENNVYQEEKLSQGQREEIFPLMLVERKKPNPAKRGACIRSYCRKGLRVVLLPIGNKKIEV